MSLAKQMNSLIEITAILICDIDVIVGTGTILRLGYPKCWKLDNL